MSDKVIEQLRKLLALSREGVGGERANAVALLEKLMNRHGVSLDELDDEAREIRWVEWRSRLLDKALLLQVIYAVTGSTGTWARHGRPNWLGFECTVAQRVMVEVKYQAYSDSLKEELDHFFSAFIQKNRIFQESAPGAAEVISDEELARLLAAMKAIRRTEVHMPLAEGGAG